MKRTKDINKENLPDIDSLWDYGNPAETEKKFREILLLAKKQKDNSYLLELETQIARTLGLQMKFEEAHKLLDSVMKKVKPTQETVRVRYMLERGRAYNSSCEKEKAKEIFESCYHQAKKYKLDLYAVDAAHMMGAVEKGNESLRWNEIAIKDAEESKDEKARRWLGSLLNNIGWTYHEMKDYEKALSNFEKALEFRMGQKNESEIKIMKWCVARCLRSMNKIDESLKMQRELLKEFESIKKEDGFVYEEIGECLLILGKENESKSFFKKAYEILFQDICLQKNEKERLTRLERLSK